MSNRIITVKIESVLGGHTPLTDFGSASQFRASIGIDPAQPIDDLDTAFSTIASGLIRPSASEKLSGTVLGSPALWMFTNPKDSNVYVYDANGSAYTIDSAFGSLTALSDGGSLTNSLGNGSAYYDNYIYFAKNTTVARYGPLNGTPAFDGDYWVATLGKTSLVNTTYPTDYKNNIRYPNHVLHRHSDGRLYMTDVVGNKGYIHYIETTTTTVEGDTGSTSTYQALDLPYGMWPTELESYGSDLAIALYEGASSNLRQPSAKLAFWDTTSTDYNKIIFVEFPDQIITALKNINGVLYVVSGNINSRGFRITRFIGGYSFEEVFYSETGEPCFAGAIDGTLNRVLMGSHTNVPESDGCVYSTGLQKSSLGRGLFNVMRATGGNDSTNVTSVCIADNDEFGFLVPIIAWTNGSGTSNNGIDKQALTYNNAPSVFWSGMTRIGQPFKILRVRIPFAQAIGSGHTLSPAIYVDNGSSSFSSSSGSLPVINSTVFPNGERIANIKTANIQGQHNFWLELRWTGQNLLTVALPILIDIEILDDQ